jgi:hypothetical protein
MAGMSWQPPSAPSRILVVTDRDPATPAVLRAIRGRAWRGPAQFLVLVPNPAPSEWHPFHPERRDRVAEAERVLVRALPQIQDVVGGPVRGHVSIRHDPLDAIEEILRDEPFDEILLAIAPHALSRRLHQDLARRLGHLGLPVTSVPDER